MLEEEAVSKELVGAEATRFRGIAARVNYLAADRPGIQYAVKEVCRRMAKPVEGGWQKLIRLGRYLNGVTKVCARVSVAGGRKRPKRLP